MVSDTFNSECEAMVDMTVLKLRPLNKSQGHSFWYQFNFSYTIRYDTVEEFDVDSKVECDQFNLAHVARKKYIKRRN